MDKNSIFKGLNSSDPVVRWRSCESIATGEDYSSLIVEGLVELLFDDVDWDCNHFVAIAALEALFRIDPEKAWMGKLSEAIKEHSEKSPDISSGMIRIARRHMGVGDFLYWLNQALPTPSSDEDSWLDCMIAWLPADWYRDTDLVAGMLSSFDQDDIDCLWRKLFSLEQMLCRRMEGCRDVDDFDGIYEEELEAVRYWTRKAPGIYRK